MERLTNFNAYYNEYDLGDIEITPELNQKVYTKLGQIEDIMEKYKIDNFDQLEYLIEAKNEYLIDYKILKKALEIATDDATDDIDNYHNIKEAHKNNLSLYDYIIERATKELSILK